MLFRSYGILTKKDIIELFDNYDNGKVIEVIDQINELNQRGVTGEVFLNKTLNYLLDKLILEKTKNIIDQKIVNLIYDLEECYKKSNKYIMIKASIIKNIGETEPIIEEKTEEKAKKIDKIISREIISQSVAKEIDEKIVEIRINNSFVKADKALKKEFAQKWESLINSYCNNGETKYLSLLKNTKIEVVSPTNVLLSTDSESNSILFNLICDDLSEKCKKDLGLDLKMICLETNQWKEEKNKYIKTKKTKEYKYIKEPKKEIKQKTLKAASEIFGDDLIEIN